MQAVATLLDLEPRSYELRDGQAVGAPTRGPTSTDVSWRRVEASVRDVGFEWGATLPRGATGQVAVSEAGPRTIRTPRLAATGIRSWQRLELYDDAPTGSSVTYRLRTGGVEYYWTGAAWAAATLAAHWSTRAQVVGNVATLTAAGRDLAVVARLATTDAAVAPWFYGALVVAGVREVGDLDDALLRSCLASLRAVVTYTTVVERLAPTGGLSSVRLSGDGADFDVEATAVEAAYDATDDAGEATPLSGSLASGVFTLATPLAAGKVLRLYVVARPSIVARAHRDAVELDRLPAVYLAPAGVPAATWAGQGPTVVRDVDAATGASLAAPESLEQDLGVRVVAELGSDLQRVLRALSVWLGAGGSRSLVSPVSGRIVDIRAITAPYETTGTLAQGVVEARAVWRVSYRAERADILRAVDLVAPGGLVVDL